MNLQDIVEQASKAFAPEEDINSAGGIKEFMEKELKEPEHSGSASSNDIEQFAKEEKSEPEHKESLNDKPDLKTWAAEEDGMGHLSLDEQGNVAFDGKTIASPEDLIAYIQKLQEGNGNEDIGGAVKTTVIKIGDLGSSSPEETQEVK